MFDEDAMVAVEEPPAMEMSGGRQERDHARREHPQQGRDHLTLSYVHLSARSGLARYRDLGCAAS